LRLVTDQIRAHSIEQLIERRLLLCEDLSLSDERRDDDRDRCSMHGYTAAK
jgi:hypothetical protein